MLVWTDADWSGNGIDVQINVPLVLCSWIIMGSKRGVCLRRWCRSARMRMRRWIIAGIKFAGVARILGLVPKVWLSKRSKLKKRCQIRLAVSTTEASFTRRTKEKPLGARKAQELLTQKAAIVHESRKLAGVAIVVAEFAFASPREPPDKMSPGQDALENAKECPSDLDTMVQEGEAMPRRVSKY